METMICTDNPLQTFQQTYRPRVEAYLDRVLKGKIPPRLWDSMRYSALAGGKRLRPLLAIAACEACGRSGVLALPVGGAIELIHTQSLIHDDLPCMDDDTLRRGKPTNHMVFGEAYALLAGDALLVYAFQLLAQELPPTVAARVIGEISRASLFMVEGQVVDLESTGMPVNEATLQYVHEHKTGAILVAAIRSGAIVGGATEAQLDALTTYAENLGLAFQITDDLLDRTGTVEKLGKTPGKDDRSKKATYPTVMGLAASREKAATCIHDALEALEGFSEAEPLRWMARFVLERDH